MTVAIIPIVIDALGRVAKGLLKGSWRPRGHHSNNSIIEIDQNTEKSFGDLRRLVVTQSPVKDHQLMLMWKTLQEKIMKWPENKKLEEKQL